MNLRFKLSAFLLAVARVFCLAGMAYYLGQAIISGVNTLGAVIYSLFPVFAFGGILFVIEIQKGNFASSFSMPALSDIKASRKYLPLFVITLIIGVLLLFYSGIDFPVHLVMVLLILIMAMISCILMFHGEGVDALCVFILAWPMMVYEQGHHTFFYWNKRFEEMVPYWGSSVDMVIYVSLLIFSWLVRVTINRQRLVSVTWSPGIWLFAVAGAISVTFSINWQLSLTKFVPIVLIPMLFFLLCVNEIRSWNDFKKLSLALEVCMGIITLVWLYYALYRNPQEASTLIELEALRGGGGRTLGSRYPGYMGVDFEYLCPLALPSVLALACTAAIRFLKRVWLGTALLMIGASVFTFSRTGWIALVICLLPWFWHLRRGRWLALSLLAGLVVAALATPEFLLTFFSRFQNLLSWERFTTEARYTIWKGSWHMFLDHPWTGIGVGMFGERGADYGLDFYVYIWEMGKRVKQINVWIEAHSTFFQIISTMGVPGLIAWVFLLWIPVRTLIRNKYGSSSWSLHERPWVIAIQSYTLVLILYLFAWGELAHWGIESPRLLLFILWLALVRIKNDLIRRGHIKQPTQEFKPMVQEFV